MQDILRSANLILADWSANRSVNLWAVDLQSAQLTQAGFKILPPPDTIMILDMYVRTYQLNAPVNVTPAFGTTLGSASVQITLANSGVLVGQFVQVVIPVSVGGLIIFGFYKVISVLGPSDFTITAASVATATVTAGGVVPIFIALANNSAITVMLSNHNYLPGQSFTVQVPTLVGNITLQGPYVIASVVDANNFTITAPIPPTANQTVAENTALAQISVQDTAAPFSDRIMTPMSRDEYAAQPNKFQQGVPSVYWFNRLIQPEILLWQVPDNNGPYELFYYRMREIQDWSPKHGQTSDMPTRFLRAFTAEMAWDMGSKYANALKAAGVMLPDLKANMTEMWGRAASQDTENASVKLQPNFSVYFRD